MGAKTGFFDRLHSRLFRRLFLVFSVAVNLIFVGEGLCALPFNMTIRRIPILFNIFINLCLLGLVYTVFKVINQLIRIVCKETKLKGFRVHKLFMHRIF